MAILATRRKWLVTSLCAASHAVFAPALGQHEFVLRFQHRDPPDFLKIAGDTGLGRHLLIRGRQPSHDRYRIVGTVVTVAFNYFRNTIICIYPPIVNLISKRYYFV